MGYLLQAVASKNMGRLDDNQRYLTQALSHLASVEALHQTHELNLFVHSQTVVDFIEEGDEEEIRCDEFPLSKPYLALAVPVHRSVA